MFTVHRSHRILVAWLLCLFCGSAEAQTIIGNNTGKPATGASTLDNDQHRAVGFTMGTQAYSLTLAKLSLAFADVGEQVVVQIRDSNGSNPGNTVLSTLTNPVFGGGTQFYSFVAPAPLTLQANTTYFLYAFKNEDTHGVLSWMQLEDNAIPVGPGAVWLNYRHGDGTTWGDASGNRSAFELEGTPVGGGGGAVPEPHSLVLLLPIGTGLALSALRRRTRRAGLS